MTPSTSVQIVTDSAFDNEAIIEAEKSLPFLPSVVGFVSRSVAKNHPITKIPVVLLFPFSKPSLLLLQSTIGPMSP